MRFLLAGSLILLLVLVLGMSSLVRLPRLNAVSLCLAGWAPVLALIELTSIAPQHLGAPLLRFCGLAFAGVIAGTTFALMLSDRKKSPDASATVINKIELGRLQVAHVLLCVLLAGYCILQIALSHQAFEASGGFAGIFSSSGGSGGASYRSALLATTRASGSAKKFSAGSALVGVISYGLYMGYGALITGSVLWAGRRSLSALFPIFALGCVGIITVQRSTFVLGLLVFACAVPFATSSLRVSNRRLGAAAKVALVAVGGLAVSVLLVPVLVRNRGTANSSGLVSLENYLVSGVVGLQQKLAQDPHWLDRRGILNGQVGPSPGLGAYTFNGLFGVLSRLGLPVRTAPHDMGYETISLSGQYFSNNIDTALAYFRMDFNMPGVFFLPAIGAVLLTWLQVRPSRVPIPWIPVAAVLAASFVWSFFSLSLIRDLRTLFVCIIAGVILRYVFEERISPTSSDRCESEGLRREIGPLVSRSGV